MVHGVLLLDKPKNISSNKALYLIKKILSPNKAGIVGILDPLASGMLPIVLNEGTKLAKYIENQDKEYSVIAKLGFNSTTGDEEGIITSTNKDVQLALSNMSLSKVLDSFIGEQKQIPPMHSGLKINGIKLYKLARQGININRKPRDINISNIELISTNKNEIKIKVFCSKGTYIRTLIESIGNRIGVGAYTKDLRRLRVGYFHENNMVLLDQIKKTNYHIIPLEAMIGEMESITITEEELQTLRYGQTVYTKNYMNIDEIAIKNQNSNLVGIGKIINNYIYTKRLMNFDE